VANTLLTIDMITREALRLAHEKATFIRTINRQFDDSFGDAGAKIGDTLRIRYPSQYTRRTGSRVMDVQDGVQLSTALTVATQDGVDMRFNSRELTLDLDEFSQLHLEPAMATLISNIDSDCIQACTKSTYNYAGTAGTAVSSLTAPGQARTRLNQNLAPKDENRRIQFDSGTMQQIVSGTAAYFNPSNAISEQFREGLVARTAMADYYENERVWTMANTTSITLSTAKMNGYLSTNGQTSLNISLLTVSAVGVGMKFTLEQHLRRASGNEGAVRAVEAVHGGLHNQREHVQLPAGRVHQRPAPERLRHRHHDLDAVAHVARLAELVLHARPHVPQGCVHVRDCRASSHGAKREVRASDLRRAFDSCVAGLGYPQRRAPDPDRHPVRVRRDPARVGVRNRRFGELRRNHEPTTRIRTSYVQRARRRAGRQSVHGSDRLLGQDAGHALRRRGAASTYGTTTNTTAVFGFDSNAAVTSLILQVSTLTQALRSCGIID
jgi:hypothetical protein